MIYSATKAAVSPGPVGTPGLFNLVPADQVEAMKLFMISTVPSGRLAEPSEIASTVMFLGSDESRFINGADIQVDGGQAQV